MPGRSYRIGASGLCARNAAPSADADPGWRRQGFKPSGYIDTITVDVVLIIACKTGGAAPRSRRSDDQGAPRSHCQAYRRWPLAEFASVGCRRRACASISCCCRAPMTLPKSNDSALTRRTNPNAGRKREAVADRVRQTHRWRESKHPARAVMGDGQAAAAEVWRCFFFGSWKL